jgi:hypothetical protein
MRAEPWQRFEARVDRDGLLEPRERARRAKISYRAFLRANARKAAKSRADKKLRRVAALQRRLARGPSPAETAAFAREHDDFIRAQIIWTAAQRGERGVGDLARRQLVVRSDCLLCRRPFTDTDPATRGGEADPRAAAPIRSEVGAGRAADRIRSSSSVRVRSAPRSGWWVVASL